MTPESRENSVVVHDAHNRRWLLFDRPARIYAANDPESVAGALDAVEQQVSKGFHAAGFISYEAAPAFDPALAVRSPEGFPLLWFGIYREPERISFPPLPATDLEDIPWQPSISENEYRLAIRRIREHIRDGDTYQVNYSFRLRALFSKNPWRFFARMIHAQGYGYGAFVDTEEWAVCSASPELFFRLDGERLISRPMKGTVSRGLWHADDLRKANWLHHSEKNRAENAMIVDMARNDMGRIANVGSVRVTSLFEVEKYPTVWQMTSAVRCTTNASVTDIFRALFPAASITGAPKPRTMRIITDLENTPRRIYTGAIGFLSPDRAAQFNVAIRTVLVNKLAKTAEYGVGGGIVWDSEETAELEECRTKAKILTQKWPDFALLETILWTPKDGYFLLDHHLFRLTGSAAYFSRPADIRLIRRKLADLEDRLPPSPHRIRLLVPQGGEPVLEARLFQPHPGPYHLRLAKKPIDSQDPFLYHKTTHRQIYEQALAESPGGDDVLLWNEKGEVMESCIANIVVEMNSRLLTPPVSSGLLPGTYRSLMLQQGEIREEIILAEDLRRCSKIYLINSLRGMWEVVIDTREIRPKKEVKPNIPTNTRSLPR